jgi:hypothetical protein
MPSFSKRPAATGRTVSTPIEPVTVFRRATTWLAGAET